MGLLREAAHRTVCLVAQIKCFAAVWVLVLAASRAEAQVGARKQEETQDAAPAEAAQEASDSDSLEMPVLLSAPEVEVPSSLALEDGKQAQVLLELTIDAEGRVVDAVVRQGASAALDEIALENARASRFSPARRNGEPVRSRILYEVVFAAPAPPPPPPPPTPPPQTPEPIFDETPIEVIVRGQSRAQKLRRSAYPVEVLELESQKRQSADLGEVLARETSVTVQRSGGLGSFGRYSLGGLGGNRVRFFLDGIPLELAGFPLGVGNVPVNLIDRVEVYQGVVPIQFGADALSGAVHLVSDEDIRLSRIGASYQGGSFDTHRVSLAGGYHHDRTGFIVRGSAFLDLTANDYSIDVEVADAEGRPSPARVRRFHDRYDAVGATLSLGVVDKPWADRFIARGFISGLDRDIQNNVIMTVPYGEVTFERRLAGGFLRYSKLFGERGALEWTAGYTYDQAEFQDLGSCRYDWLGQCVFELPTPGEITGVAVDQRVRDHTGFVRALGTWRPAAKHELRLAAAATSARRRGRDREIPEDQYDALRANRGLDTVVVGLEYEVKAWKDRFVNIAFVKGYWQALTNRELGPNNDRIDQRETFLRPGGGNSMRIAVHENLYLKASYEYAARLPTPAEAFGDGGLIIPNLELSPELGHNFNLGTYVDAWSLSFGTLRGSIEGIVRLTDDLIVLLPSGNFAQFANVLTARALGATGSLGYTTPKDIFGVDGRVSYQDLRNTSSDGPYALFEGDRIPNIPYLESSASSFVRIPRVTSDRDFIELFWSLRYVHEFFLGWESAATGAERLTIPNQLVHSLALTYATRGRQTNLAMTVEVQNLTDEIVFDFYGVQRPGRAFFFKVILNMNETK